MRIKTQSTVTIVMSGAEATELAAWLNSKGAATTDGPQSDLLLELRELPDEYDGEEPS